MSATLPPKDLALRMFLHVLQKASRGRSECWRSNQWLADQLGRSVRWVQLALARLAAMGFIEIIRDYKLSTRRRIVLLPNPSVPTTA